MFTGKSFLFVGWVVAVFASYPAQAASRMPAHTASSTAGPRQGGAAPARDAYELPTLLTDRFYKVQDVCSYARKKDPDKKAALVLLKTHLCDAGSLVCMSSLRTISDPANVFVRDNFVTFHTRFIAYSLDDSAKFYSSHYGGEAQIRKEWKKQDVNPEVVLVDLKTCKVMGRNYLMSFPGAFDDDFQHRYRAMKNAILAIPGASNLTGVNPRSRMVQEERRLVDSLRRRYPEIGFNQVFQRLERQTSALGLQPISTVVIAEANNVKEAKAVIRQEGFMVRCPACRIPSAKRVTRN